MRSLIGQCAECCTCPEVVVLVSTVSESASKEGYPGNIGSTPPKRFRKKQWSGERRETSYAGPGCTGSSSTDTLAIGGSAEYADDGSCVAAFTSTYNGVTTPITSCAASSVWATEITSDTTKEDPDRGSTGVCVGTATIDEASSKEELLNEDLTSDMVDRLDAALGAATYPGYAAGNPVASFSVAVSELSAGGEASKYKIAHKVPLVGGGLCYKAKWVERFTPAGGGDPEDTEKTYTWDGITPGGYDPATQSTWPTSGVFTMARPASQGETIIGYYTDPEDPETFVENYVLFTCEGCE